MTTLSPRRCTTSGTPALEPKIAAAEQIKKIRIKLQSHAAGQLSVVGCRLSAGSLLRILVAVSFLDRGHWYTPSLLNSFASEIFRSGRHSNRFRFRSTSKLSQATDRSEKANALAAGWNESSDPAINGRYRAPDEFLPRPCRLRQPLHRNA